MEEETADGRLAYLVMLGVGGGDETAVDFFRVGMAEGRGRGRMGHAGGEGEGERERETEGVREEGRQRQRKEEGESLDRVDVDK